MYVNQQTQFQQLLCKQFFYSKDMSIKFNYGNYTITTDFKDDFNLSMTASDNFSGDYFLNQKVQLTKIKKDTIIATLSRKNEEHLKCDFSVIDVQPRKLVISFVVSFDFLPTFTEYVSLDQIQNKKGLNKVESAQLRSDIQELDKLISAISTNKGICLAEKTLSISGKGDLHSQEIARGSYLIEVSGFYTCTTGGAQKHDLSFVIEVDKEKHEQTICSYTNSSYGYPVFMRTELIVPLNGTLKIFIQHKQGSTFTLTNCIVTISPMLKIR